MPVPLSLDDDFQLARFQRTARLNLNNAFAGSDRLASIDQQSHQRLLDELFVTDQRRKRFLKSQPDLQVHEIHLVLHKPHSLPDQFIYIVAAKTHRRLPGELQQAFHQLSTTGRLARDDLQVLRGVFQTGWTLSVAS